MDHYSFPRTSEATDAELGRPGKGMGTTKMVVGSKHFFDVMQHT